MIATFWSGLAGKLADRTALVLLGPATAFWAIGFLAWAGLDAPAKLPSLVAPTAGQPEWLQLILVAAGLVVLLVSSVIAERLTPIALRVLRGDWPRAFDGVRRRLETRHSERKEALESRWEDLSSTIMESSGDDDRLAREERDLLDVERRLSAYPVRSAAVAPTRLGNVLRAADTRVLDKYGLDAARCWPALWLIAPDVVRTEIADARKALDAATLWWVWSMLLAIWLIFDLRVIAVLAVAALLTYQSTVAAAAQYGELVDAAYTVHRGLLYDAAGWPRPNPSAGDETRWGRALTTAMWRGPDLADRPRPISS